ncbi:MAG TPA: ABC transporter substrate-binding protein, partial [Candidatus Methylomirabilis sp.]|nr:ABC transporter substrate-binding protein [Candidatus Methylomirabilis sp.]
QDDYRKLVFFLRSGVKWHDGQAFSSKDVVYTFDVLRKATGVPAKLRLNPRREWYTNVEAIEAPDPLTVVFRLKRPQPSLLLILASGFTPIYAAHVSPGSYRTGCMGTGPFKVKEWHKGEFVEYVRNPDYFVKDRPYLDGLRYQIIAERGTATAALQSGRVDVSFPGETPRGIAEQLRAAAPSLVITRVGTSVLDHLIINTRRPPFDNLKVRQAVSRAIDRRAYVGAVYQGGAVLGASMPPNPYGVWGMLEADLRAIPGHGSDPNGERMKARAALVNYSGYCNEQIARLIEQQSQELDPKRRLALVQEIQKKLEEAAARPALAWRLDYFAVSPYVKNLIPHNSLYGWGRMQDVWRDR